MQGVDVHESKLYFATAIIFFFISVQRMTQPDTSLQSLQHILDERTQEMQMIQTALLLQIDTISQHQATQQRTASLLTSVKELLAFIRQAFASIKQEVALSIDFKEKFEVLQSLLAKRENRQKDEAELQVKLKEQEDKIRLYEKHLIELRQKIADTTLSQEVFRAMENKLQVKDKIIHQLRHEAAVRENEKAELRQRVEIQRNGQQCGKQLSIRRQWHSQDEDRQGGMRERQCNSKQLLKEIIEDTLNGQKLGVIEEQQKMDQINDKENRARISIYKQSLKEAKLIRDHKQTHHNHKPTSNHANFKPRHTPSKKPIDCKKGQFYERLLRKETKYERLAQNVLKGKECQRKSFQLM